MAGDIVSRSALIFDSVVAPLATAGCSTSDAATIVTVPGLPPSHPARCAALAEELSRVGGGQGRTDRGRGPN